MRIVIALVKLAIFRTLVPLVHAFLGNRTWPRPATTVTYNAVVEPIVTYHHTVVVHTVIFVNFRRDIGDAYSRKQKSKYGKLQMIEGH